MAETDEKPQTTSIRTIGVWLILGALALVFGLSFGLPTDALTSSTGSGPIARVHGTGITRDDYTYQYAAIASTLRIPEDERFQELMGLKEEVLEASVERLVLAETAEGMGLGATTRDAEMLVADGHVIVLGDTLAWLGDRPFNYDAFKGLLQRLKISEPRFLEIQRQEILARTVRDLVASTTVVPEAELRAEYERRANRLSLNYVRFPSRSYAQLYDPTTEEIAAFVLGHNDDLKAKLATQGARFTKLPKQVRLRFIEVKKPVAPADDADAEVTKAHTEALAKARTKIDGALERLTNGEDFRAVARSVSENADTARSGGEYGWVSVEGTGSGLDPAVDKAAKGLEAGFASNVVEGDTGYYLVQVAGKREGDVPEADALAEIAEDQLKDEHGKDLAKQAASEAVLLLKGGKSMAEAFAPANPLAGGGGIDALPLGGTATPGSADGKPQMRTTGLFGKEATIPGLGAMPELTEAAWAADASTEVIDKVIETKDGFLVAGIDKKEVGSDEGFAEQRSELFRELLTTKANGIAAKWARQRCFEAKGQARIVPDEAQVKALLTYDTKLGEDEAGKDVMRPYQMCDRVGGRGGMLRTSALLGGGAGR